MRARGWFRLWVVLTLIGVPVAAEWQFQQSWAIWQSIDQQVIKNCVEAVADGSSSVSSFQCEKNEGVLKTFFQREEITPLAYWSQSLGFFFAVDLVLTALVLGAFFTVLWVWRGFRPLTKAAN